MNKRHDEMVDVKLLKSVAHIDVYNKTIKISKNQIIGNTRWGRIDYLTNHCGYTLLYDNSVKVISSKDLSTKEVKERIKRDNKHLKLKRQK